MNLNSTQPPLGASKSSGHDAAAGTENQVRSARGSFWRRVLKLSREAMFIPIVVVFCYGKIHERGEGAQEAWGMTMEITFLTGLVCLSVAILKVVDYGRSKASREDSVFREKNPANSSEGTAETKHAIWSEMALLGAMLGAIFGAIFMILRSCDLPRKPEKVGPPPATMPATLVTTPAHPTVERSKATLAYWNTTVRNLHEARFKVPPSERPSEQVVTEIVGQLKVLSDQAKVAAWDSVDQDLVSMVIRHSFIDDKAFQLKALADELKQQNPTLVANPTSFNEAMAQWQQVVAAVQADSDLLSKLPEGPLRQLVESSLEYEQRNLDQLREIEAMQVQLQERYPGIGFTLPDISE